MPQNDPRRERTEALRLHGLLAHWDQCVQAPWLDTILSWEETERTKRSLDRRMRNAHIGRFKPIVDIDWSWIECCDRAAIEDLMTLDFMKSATNVILVGSSGLGKTTIAQNIAHQAVILGYTVMFTTAGQLLGELAALDSDSALRYRLRRYAAIDLLVIDEVGYLSYSNRHADLMFEIIHRRHEKKSTIITTNKSFTEWADVFPNAACVVAMIDRLVHHAEIISIQGNSYRQKEAKEHTVAKSRSRKEKGKRS